MVWAATAITGSAAATYASCAISTVILVLKLGSLVADATSTASVLIADVATRIGEVACLVTMSLLSILLLIGRHISLLWVIAL